MRLLVRSLVFCLDLLSLCDEVFVLCSNLGLLFLLGLFRILRLGWLLIGFSRGLFYSFSITCLSTWRARSRPFLFRSSTMVSSTIFASELVILPIAM